MSVLPAFAEVSAAQHMQAGAQAQSRGDTSAAIAEFQAATEADPHLEGAYLSLGEEYMRAKRFPDAIAPLKRAVDLNAGDESAELQLGYALLACGYAADAIPHLDRVHAAEGLGIAQIETGQLEAAVRNLSAALAQRPNDADLLYYLGRAAGLLSKRSIDKLMAAYPNSPRSRQAMGENYFVLRQMPQAEEQFSAALQQEPELPGLHMELGMVYASSAQWPRAEKEFRAEVGLQPGNAEAWYRLGSALLQQGEASEAREQLEKANGLRPGMPETLYAIGKADSLAGDANGAIQAWSSLLGIETNTPLAAQAHFGLSGIYRKQGEAAKAREEMQAFEKLQNTIPRER